jgi:hypothetical protein
MQTIFDLVRKQEQNYIAGNTTISRYVHFNQYDNIEKIDAYLNSKHISGETDSLGREKPFFNIVTAAVNIWYRATDLDRKDIRVKATKQSDYFPAFLATVHLQQWMRRENFGSFLKDWGRSLARYGSTVLKFVEQKGELHWMIVPWNRLIADPVDFDAAPKIEKLYLTPAQLRMRKGYDQEMVEKLISAVGTRKTLDKQNQDTRADYIELYEVHGELPLCFITEKEKDDKKYVQQMHVISFLENEKKDGYDDFSLISGREAQDPYMITHLIREDGRTQAIGAVEHLFEAQWMVNHSAKAIKDQLDLASKLIFQTADPNFVGQNALAAIENGDILIHADGKPLIQLQNNSHDITSLQNFSAQWQALAKDITSTPDAISGQTMPSGTPFRQVAILNQESHSLFEVMTENKGIHVEEMMRRFIIPFLKKQMDTTEEISATLDDYHITQIDALYTKNKAIQIDNNQKKKAILSGQIASNQDLAALQSSVQDGLNTQGNQRFFKPSDIPSKTWKEIFKDLEWDLDVEVTNETGDKATILQTLSTVLTNIASNPALLNNPNAKLVFNKILEATGVVSPVELMPPTSPFLPPMTERLTIGMDYKDLPPAGQIQAAQRAGITLQPQDLGQQPQQTPPPQQPQRPGAQQQPVQPQQTPQLPQK